MQPTMHSKSRQAVVGRVNPTARAVEPPLDPEVLDAMRSVSPDGGTRLLERIAAAFADDAPRQVLRMRGAVASGDAVDLQRSAHALKSSAGSIGADRLARLCAVLESDARAGRIADAAEMLPTLDTQVAAVQDALHARIATEGAHGFR